jgi:adenylate kinase
MPTCVVMLGPPGAGKGTQAARLAARVGVPRISTGDILREAVHGDTALGRSVKQVMESGRLVDDDLIVQIVRARLEGSDTDAGFVLDGFPRTVVQARALDGIMARRGPLSVLYLEAPTETLVQRLSTRRICDECGANESDPHATRCARCGGPIVTRRDDSEEVVRERLQIFHERTEPLVAFYESRPSFVRIDGTWSPDSVAAAIEQALAPVIARRAAGAERS